MSSEEVERFDVIYVDIIFLINFVMNIFLLAITGKIRHMSVNTGSLFRGAAFGALMAVVLSILRLPAFLEAAVGWIGVPAIMLMTTFKKKNIETGIINFTALYMTAFLLGGSFSFLFGHTAVFSCISPISTIHEKSAVIFFCCGAGALLLTILCLRFFLTKKQTGCVRVILMIHENRVELEAIIDTGNRLYEPIECRPVSIVESAAVRQYFNETDRKRIRVVPFHSIGRKHGLLYALPVDFLKVPERNICICGAMIAFYNGTIDEKIHMIRHPDLMEK